MELFSFPPKKCTNHKKYSFLPYLCLHKPRGDLADPDVVLLASIDLGQLLVTGICLACG